MYTTHERERLMLYVAGQLARDRKERGLLLNYPEAVSLISAQILEWAREGRAVADLMDAGRTLLTKAECMEGVPDMIDQVQIEATFPDGTKLVTVHNPVQ